MNATPAANQVRTLVIAFGERAEGDGRIPVVVSTDAPVEMPDGIEVLDHNPESIDLSRAPLPLIATHKGEQINVGLVEDLVTDGRVLRGFARFGKRDEAVGYETDVLGGVIRSVSVGYRRMRARQLPSGGMRTTLWRPTHVAMVAEPADIGAGFYRHAESTEPFVFEVPAEPEQATAQPLSQPSQPETRTMAPEAATPAAPAATAATATPAAPAINASEIAAQARSAEQTRVREIMALGDQFERYGARDIARRMLDSGATVEAARAEVMNAIAAAQTSAVTHLDMSPQEERRFSLMRAVRGLVEKDPRVAGIEQEAHRAICQRLGIKDSPNGGIFVPADVQASRRWSGAGQQRDLTVGTATAGGNLVATDLAASSFIELLRARSVVARLGAKMLPGLVGNLTIPKQTGSATAYWLTNEATAITESQQTIGQVALTPKTLGAYTELSRLLMLQSTPAADQMVMNDLARVLALSIDLKALEGDGTGGTPTGIANTAGIGAVTGTTLGYAGVIEFQTDVAAANALTPNCAFVTTPTIAGTLMQRQRFSSTDTPLWTGTVLDGQLGGYQATTTTQVTAASMTFGDFEQVVIGEWGFLEIGLNPYANYPAGIVGIRAIQTVDVAIRQAAAFSRATSIT